MSKILKQIIPAYPFVQYRDDPNIVAFFTAYNDLAQQYLDSVNSYKLPYWPAAGVSGALLDFVVKGIYGEERPEQQLTVEEFYEGIYNTTEYNETPYATLKDYVPGETQYVADDLWKRVLTWNFYKADGQQFTITWLKRRIARFLFGAGGRDPRLENTYDISITVDSGHFKIKYPNAGGVGLFLRAAIEQKMVYLPFQYTYEITVFLPDND